MTTKITLILSTLENFSRECAECGIVIRQSRGAGNDPTEQALDSLTQSVKNLRCDAMIAMRLVSYPGIGLNPPTVVAYGTAIK
jgi:uncharacterized protein YbjQ (UPF0145 family)